MIAAKAILVGNLGQEPEGRYTPQGKYIATVSIGVNTGWGDKKSTSWFKLNCWGDLGELFNKLCQKGTKVLVEGRLKINEWNDKDGNKRTSVEVDVTDFNVLARGREKETQEAAAAAEEEFPY